MPAKHIVPTSPGAGASCSINTNAVRSICGRSPNDTVVNSINEFTVPSGLFQLAASDEEIAAALAHECEHVIANHVAKRSQNAKESLLGAPCVSFCEPYWCRHSNDIGCTDEYLYSGCIRRLSIVQT
ncbi:MAG: M48 family metalloprotease [Gammaproteobacteria bacterium]|nr:M48 family metalloprotease [Gammaproteobacteria bacterium]MYD80970.1 M48 family metalloprotease [Gammaproteobacteria bacterium]